jgi:hypothetical protein
MIAAAGVTLAGFAGATPAHAAIAWRHPFPFRANVSSPFGYRIHPIYGDRRLHAGIDYAGPPSAGTPIHAVASGVVVSSGYNAAGFGHNITIDHGQGFRSLYGHMQEGTRRALGPVQAGAVVGRVGSTGASTGAHLHLGIELNGQFVDPAPYINNAPLANTNQGDPDMPSYELVRAQDQLTVWFSVDRIHRYAIPNESVLADYQYFLTQKGLPNSVLYPVNLQAFGTPVFQGGAPVQQQA